MTTLMAIGGAMDFEEPVVFEEFIRRAGGVKANIVVLPQASSLAQTGKGYSQAFQKLGIKKKPVSLEFRTRAKADEKSNLQALRRATGIFIAGGTQMRLTSLMGGTRFEEELLAAYQQRRGDRRDFSRDSRAIQDHDRLWSRRTHSTRADCSIFPGLRLHRQNHLRPALPST